MKIKDLKLTIETLPDDMEVILQRDPEGNGYSPASGADAQAIYIPESRDVYDSNWSAEDACISESQWSEMKMRPRALVIFPMY